MASGVITGSRYGGSYGPWLSIHYNEVQRDTANNRTKLRLTLRFHSDAPGGIYYTFNNRTGYLQGQSFSYSGTASGTSVLLNLHQRDVWFSHNSDGTRRVTLSGDIRNLGLYFGGTSIGTMAVSGSVNLTPIQRSSTLSAFSFPSHLKEGVESTINYTVNRHNSNFRHQLQLKDGSVTVLQWQSVNSNGSSTLSLTGSQVNQILARMPNSTSKTFTLRLATRREHNGSFVGAVNTRTATATVHADVKPYINWTSAKVTGNAWAVGKGLFVQGQTGVEADFSSNSTGYANIASRSISIGGNSGGGIVDNVFRHSVGVLRQSGNHTITYTITDTRGRSTSTTRTINVLAYSPPRIDEFKAERQSNETTVRIDRRGTTHTLGGRNTASLTIVETLSNGTSGNAQHIASFSGNFNNYVNRTVSGGLSATYTLTVSDTLGNQAHSTVTVGTAFMEFSIRRGEGIGVGKNHQRGALDVEGEAYFTGSVQVHPKGNRPSFQLHSNDSNGHGYLEFFNNASNRQSYIGIPSSSSEDVDIQSWRGINLKPGGGRDVQVWGVPIVDSGSNNNGEWVRFYDGTQICWQRWTQSGVNSHSDGNGLWRSGHIHKAFAKSFIGIPSVSIDAVNDWRILGSSDTDSSTSLKTVLWRAGGNIGSTQILDYIAIGRWK